MHRFGKNSNYYPKSHSRIHLLQYEQLLLQLNNYYLSNTNLKKPIGKRYIRLTTSLVNICAILTNTIKHKVLYGRVRQHEKYN